MVMRITGMGSGLDIDKLVTDLMKAERMPLDKLKQKKTTVGWTSDLYREVNTKLTALRNAANNIRLTGDWKDYKATSSNENAVSATTSAGVPVGNHTVEVKQLAEGAKISTELQTPPLNIDPNAKMGNNGKLAFITKNLETGAEITDTIEYNKDETLKDVITRVNSQSKGIRMSFDDLTNSVSIVTKATGLNTELTISDTGGNQGALAAGGITRASAKGKDAEAYIDTVKVTPHTNTFSANGITYTFKDKAEGTAAVKITVAGDSDGMVKQIKDFVEQYNATLDLLNQRSKEVKAKGFNPLTDDQKADMKEADIKSWEDKAKQGLLGNDEILKSTLRELRSIVNNTVISNPQESNALFKIGINTMPYNASSPNDSGKLYIDEEQLRKSISEDAGSVVSLFTDQTSGIASKMYETVNKSITQLIEKAGGVSSPTESVSTTLGQKMIDINAQIQKFNTKLAAKESYYYKMFAAMDSAVGKNNAQLNWLLSNG